MKHSDLPSSAILSRILQNFEHRFAWINRIFIRPLSSWDLLWNILCPGFPGREAQKASKLGVKGHLRPVLVQMLAKHESLVRFPQFHLPRLAV